MTKRKAPYWTKHTAEGYRNPDYDKFLRNVKFGILLFLLLVILFLVLNKEILMFV